MKKIRMRIFSAIWVMGALCACLFHPEMTRTGSAAFGEDTEKPRPAFSRNNDRVTARYIPRAKSSSVLVHFTVSKGRLLEVRGMDFEEADRPEVDVKNFKSALFTLKIEGVDPGGEAVVTVSSDFFTTSTQFYVFNERLPNAWMDARCENISLPDRVQDLVIKVKDGGPYDSDGKANGMIFFVGGPRDSFWGYALGTLFIRFFGIFLVLIVLMIGMRISGRIFEKFDGQNPQGGDSSESGPGHPPPVPDNCRSDNGGQDVDTQSVAATAAALHFHFSKEPAPEYPELITSETDGWAQHGRFRAIAAHTLKGERGRDRFLRKEHNIIFPD